MTAEVIRYGEDQDFHIEKKRGGRLEIPMRSRFAVALAEGGSGILGIGSKHYRFSDGDLLIIKDAASAALDCEEDARVTLFIFRPYFLSEALRGRMRDAEPVVGAGDITEEASAMLARISAELKRGDEFSGDACRAMTTELCVKLARSAEAAAEATEVCPAVEAVLAYVREHLGERLSLADMARSCKVSVAYLSRKFKAEVGTGFADHVARLRLERAEMMLRERPEMSVTEIAFICGFNDSNYFSDKFKNHFGLSPLKFRKSI